MAAMAAAMLGGVSVLMTLTFGTKLLFAGIGAAVVGCQDKMLFYKYCSEKERKKITKRPTNRHTDRPAGQQ